MCDCDFFDEKGDQIINPITDKPIEKNLEFVPRIGEVISIEQYLNEVDDDSIFLNYKVLNVEYTYFESGWTRILLWVKQFEFDQGALSEVP